MRKFVLVPLVKLDHPWATDFLEIMTESALFGGINLASIEEQGLSRCVDESRLLLKRIPPLPSSKVYLTREIVNLNASSSLSLALVLACSMQHSWCRYAKIIASGTLNPFASSLTITETEFFETKLAAVLDLPYSPSTLPWYFPESQLGLLRTRHIDALMQMNIQLKPVVTLSDILYDLGLPPILDTT